MVLCGDFISGAGSRFCSQIHHTEFNMSATWETGIFGCCEVKDCGVMCCCKLYCGAPCIFGSAMEKAGLGSCCSCCCFSSCCYPCAVFNARTSVAAKYGITESMPESLLYAFCCCGCSFIQVINQVLSPNGSPSVVSISTPPPPSSTPPGTSVCPLLSGAPLPFSARPPLRLTHCSPNKHPQILVKENQTWECCGVSASSGGAPEIETMER